MQPGWSAPGDAEAPVRRASWMRVGLPWSACSCKIASRVPLEQ